MAGFFSSNGLTGVNGCFPSSTNGAEWIPFPLRVLLPLPQIRSQSRRPLNPSELAALRRLAASSESSSSDEVEEARRQAQQEALERREEARRLQQEARERREEARRLREELREQERETQRLNRAMRRLEISARQARSEDRRTAVAHLARETAAVENPGVNIGVFGQTSTGKSTIVNALLGKSVAATGVGETTTAMTPYRGTNYTLWDAPGRNDEVDYTKESFIAFLKGLTRRLIIVQSTLKENSELMQLLDSLELNYDIVVNKLDDVPAEERASFQKQIWREVQSHQLTHKGGLYFISAKFPQMFPNWLDLAKSLADTVLV